MGIKFAKRPTSDHNLRHYIEVAEVGLIHCANEGVLDVQMETHDPPLQYALQLRPYLKTLTEVLALITKQPDLEHPEKHKIIDFILGVQEHYTPTRAHIFDSSLRFEERDGWVSKISPTNFYCVFETGGGKIRTANYAGSRWATSLDDQAFRQQVLWEINWQQSVLDGIRRTLEASSPLPAPPAAPEPVPEPPPPPPEPEISVWDHLNES